MIEWPVGLGVERESVLAVKLAALMRFYVKPRQELSADTDKKK